MARNTKSIAAKAMSMTSEEWSLSSLMKLPERELRQLYSQQRDVERKRMSALEKSGYSESGILQRFDLAPKLSTLKSKQDIARELSDIHRFIGLKTSTVSGMRETEANFKREMEKVAGKKLSDAEAYQIGRLMNKVNAAIREKTQKYAAMSAMMSFAETKGIKNPDKFFRDINFWKNNIDRLEDLSRITTPSGRTSQSSEAYKRAIKFYDKLKDFTGE